MKRILLILTFVFSLIRLEAQVPCPNDNSFWLDLTPSGVGNTNTSFCTYAGDYDTFTACNGVQYGISVCGSYNVGVTMYDNSGTLLYSQNAVGTGVCETFTWTSTINGVVRILVDITNSTFSASTSGVKAKLTLGQNIDQLRVVNITAIDIDSSNGRRVNNFYGTATNCDNWRIWNDNTLPQVSSTF